MISQQLPTPMDPAMAAYLGIRPPELGELGERHLDPHTGQYSVPIPYRTWISDTKIDAEPDTGKNCYVWVLVYNPNYLEYWGDCQGLERDVNATNCMAREDSCSLGILTGDFCYNEAVQGGLLINGTNPNPYNAAKYQTTNRGRSFPWSGFHGNISDIGWNTQKYDGLPFISKLVHCVDLPLSC
jgi:hypothetical protein